MGEFTRLAIVLAGARLLCLGVLALLLTLPCDSSVEAVNFAYSGFEEDSFYPVFYNIHDLVFDTATGCFQISPLGLSFFASASSRLLYPLAVQMIDPCSTTVKSFSTSFIYRFQRIIRTGPGPVDFIMVPDTLGTPGDYMGLISYDADECDDHLGVELDTFMNREFGDTDNNHIGINLNYSVFSFSPDRNLVLSTKYRQIWIDYDEAASRMDIYLANYKERKPDKPQERKFR